MKRYRSALAAFLVAATAAMPCAAQQVRSTPRIADEACAGCFAYLEFSPSLEPESYAMRGQATETSAPPPAASEPSGGFSEQTARLLASPKQQARTADLRPHPQTRIGAMTQHQPLLPARAARCNELRPQVFEVISSLGTRIARWITTAADYYSAAAVYEQLSQLSDAELQRRGLSRATLARDACEACDTAAVR